MDYLELAHHYSKLRGGTGISQGDLKKARDAMKLKKTVEEIKNRPVNTGKNK